MREIFKIEKPNIEEEKIEIPQLKDFPENVRSLFSQLPDSLRVKILPSDMEDNKKVPCENLDSGLEGIVAGFDDETRQKFMKRCLGELFITAKFKDRFQSVGEENLGKELERLLNLLWQNRGKRNSIELFNQEYYDKFFEDRGVIIEKINAKKAEIEKLENSIENTKKQKRLTERKKNDFRKLLEELELLTDELRNHDDKHDNYKYFPNVSSRIEKEMEWTKAAAITSEYLGPTEFAFIMGEQLEIIFYREFSIASQPERKRFGVVISEDIVKRAQKITELVSQVVDNWHSKHKDDRPFKDKVDTKLEVRKAKLIEYLISLFDAYKRGKELKKSEEEMHSTVIQMEVSLNFLLKLPKSKE